LNTERANLCQSHLYPRTTSTIDVVVVSFKISDRTRTQLIYGVALVFFLLMLINPWEADKDWLNIWTLGHFIVGVALGLMKVRPKVIVPVLTTWEVLEQFLFVPLGLAFPAEAIMDSIIDILVGFAGWVIGRGIVRNYNRLDVFVD
jgi:hypothetical protein